MEILQELELFVLLTEEGSFTGAARRLGVPRATLSRRISRFEEALGVILLERSTRALRLTEAGRLLIERGEALVGAARALQEEVRQVDEVPRGPLVVAAQTGLGRGFISRFIGQLRERCPLVELCLISTPQPLVTAARDADVVLTEGPLEDMDWHAVPLGPSDRVAVASPAYLARRGAPRALGELAAHDLLSPAEAPRQALRWPLWEGGEIPIRAAVTANNLDTVLECAVGGLGIALLPFTVVSPSLAAGELALVLSDQIGQEAQLYALYPPHRRGSPKIRAFLSTMEAFIEAEATPMLSALGAVVADPDDGS